MKAISARVYDAIVSHIDSAVVVCNGENCIEYFNDASKALLGLDKVSSLNQVFSIFSADQGNDQFYRGFQQTIYKDKTWQGKHWISTKNNESQLVELKVVLLVDEQQQAEHFIYIVSRAATKIPVIPAAKSTQHDPLTKLPNRLLFCDRTDQAIISTKREGKSVAVLLFGLDRFTIVNQGLGHASGDKLLIDVAKRLSTCIRGSDTVARTEGDNFALLLQVTAVDDGVIVAEKVLKSMLTHFTLGDQKVTLTASIGISLCPTDSKDTDELLKHASSALFHAKRNGGNQYQFFSTTMNDKAKFRIELENKLRRAIKNEEFMLYYQPKVSAETKKIVGAEALIRWQDPNGKLISPAEFIPVAEESGLIEPIGTWVLEQACRQTRAWQLAKLPFIKMSVNVSAHQFRSPTFLDIVTRALTLADIESRYIELEITESMLMTNPEQTIEKLKAIRALGCHLSIDDFGTGYSSLSYLTKFPITTLKIDRAFVYDIETNRNMAEVAKAIIGLSQGLELEVVAEGAESIEHVEFLRENGCELVQGYYYSKPLPQAEFEKILKIGSIGGG